MQTTHIHRFAAAIVVVSLVLALPRAAWCLDVTDAGVASTIDLLSPLPPVSHTPRQPSQAEEASMDAPVVLANPAAVEFVNALRSLPHTAKLPSKAQLASVDTLVALPNPEGGELISTDETLPTDLAIDDCDGCSSDNCCCSQGHVQSAYSCPKRSWHNRGKHCRRCANCSCVRPFGSCNFMATRNMIVNGLRDQMVLYEYDFGFGDNAGTLKDRGVYQLEKMINRIPIAGSPVIIQKSSDAKLDALRQQHVLATLARLGMELEPEMVVVGRPGVRGLDGVEALPIYGNLLEQTRLRGNVGIETSGLSDVGFGSSASGSAAGGSPNGRQ